MKIKNTKTFLHPTNHVQNWEVSECDLLESIQETFYIVCRLVLQDFYAAFHLKRNEQYMSTEDPELHPKPEPWSDV